jgi:uncharacterized phage-associated protein
MYEARKICNLLISRSDEHKHPLTNLRINKLLYFVHGWGLTRNSQGFVRNHFLAWTFGPIVKPVFDEFKLYGDRMIDQPAQYLDYATGKYKVIPYNDISPHDIEIIMRVFLEYDRYSTYELVDMTHEPNGPWDIIFKELAKERRLNQRIPNDLIRDHFFKMAGGKVRH